MYSNQRSAAHLAHGQAERPVWHGEDWSSERYRDEEKDEVTQCQWHDEDVGRVAHLLVQQHNGDQCPVTDDAAEENECKDNGNDDLLTKHDVFLVLCGVGDV